MWNQSEMDALLEKRQKELNDADNNTSLVLGEGISRQKKLRRKRDRSLTEHLNHVGTCGKRTIKLGCSACGTKEYRIYYCGSRICPACAREYSRVVKSQIAEISGKIKIPYGMGWKMITLTTLKTHFSDDIKKAISGLGKLWHNLLENTTRMMWTGKYYKSGKKKGQKKMVKVRVKNGVAALAHLELAPGGMIHWHILYLGRYIPYATLRRAWLKATGDSPVAFIQGVEFFGGLGEVCKYITKFPKVNHGMLAAFYAAVKNFRALRTFGLFYKRIKNGGGEMLICPQCGGYEWDFLGIEELTDFHRHQIGCAKYIREAG